MKTNSSWRIRLAQILLGSAIVLALVAPRGIYAQGRDDRGHDLKGWDGKAPENPPVHLTTDWSDKHVVFSSPDSLVHQFQLSKNERYVRQSLRRNAEKKGDPNEWRWRRAPETPDTLKGDWSLDMGPGATVGEGNYPAKFSFDTTSANCAELGGTTPQPSPDFVVYNTSLAGVATPVAAHQTVTFGSSGSGTPPAGTVIITNGANTLTLTATTGASSGTNFHVVADNGSGNRNANASSLATAINLAGNGSSVGVSATFLSNVVTIMATTAGSAGNSIALTGTIDGSHGVSLDGETLAGGIDGQATIAAFTNLYVGTCSNVNIDVPNLYWAYNTGTTGAVVTSVVLSVDGTQVAFVQGTGGAANLVLLKWVAFDGSLASPTNITDAQAHTHTVTNANYRTCTAPCMTTISFGTAAHTDTNSSPFYDYASGSDTIYVGDDDGYLHRFAGVFNGTPGAEPTGWPVAVTTGNILTSPVFDESAGKIYVAANDHSVNSVNAASRAVISSGSLTGGSGVDFVDSPIVDFSTGQIYVFSGRTSGNSPATAFQIAIATFPTVTHSVSIGATSTTVPVHAGDFDNTYYTSAGGTGNLYVCGNPGGSPILYRIAVTSGNLGAITTGPTLTNVTTPCSPVTEFYNSSGTPADYIFMSMQNTGSTHPTNCTTGTGCIVSFNLGATDNVTFNTSLAPTGSARAAGGASGVIIDNSSSSPGASQVYFTPLANQACTTSGGTGGCAIQASQSSLSQ